MLGKGRLPRLGTELELAFGLRSGCRVAGFESWDKEVVSGNGLNHCSMHIHTSDLMPPRGRLTATAAM